MMCQIDAILLRSWDVEVVVILRWICLNSEWSEFFRIWDDRPITSKYAKTIPKLKKIIYVRLLLENFAKYD